LGRELVQTLATENHVLSVIGRSAPSDSDAKIPNVDYRALDLLDQSRLKKTLGEIVSCRGKLNNLVFFQRYRGDGDSWEGEIQTSLTATMNTIQHLTDDFRPGETNAIVIVGSIASHFIADEQPLSYHVGKAGLGQLGKHGSLICEEYGSNIRIASVLTDLPLVPDTKTDIGVEDLCLNCQRCTIDCPPDAITDTKQMVRGVEKWYVDFDRCVPYFSITGGCAICIQVCPFSENGPKLSQQLLKKRSRNREKEAH